MLNTQALHQNIQKHQGYRHAPIGVQTVLIKVGMVLITKEYPVLDKHRIGR